MVKVCKCGSFCLAVCSKASVFRRGGWGS
uniref:Uncharacterized protein n=1 Tax=Anguilla anguilla TaxID=7936 RepID=A0A0E9UR22_ANGAN